MFLDCSLLGLIKVNIEGLKLKIAHVDIQNFRKLKSCRIDFDDKNTIFVGANNSGKTSAMDALIMFLKKTKRKDISTTDITISNWQGINQIGSSWIASEDEDSLDLSLDAWRPLLPSLDVWISVDDSHIFYQH